MTFDLKVFCAVIVFELLLTAGLALADDRPGYSVKVIGRKSVTITTPTVKLGDLAEVSAPRISSDDAVIALQKIVIDKSPAPGKEAQISADRVLERLREEGVDLQQVGYFLPKSMSVQRAARAIGLQEVTDAIQEFLKGTGKDLGLREVQYNSRIKVAPGELELRAVPYNSSPAGQVGFSLSARVPGEEPVNFTAAARIDEWRQVPVAKRPVNRGSVIADEDVVMARMNINALPRDAAVSPADIIGFEAGRDVASGEPFRQNTLAIPPVIASGSRVILKYQSGLFEATATGVAMEAGGAGQEIKVKNGSSNKIVTGRVIEPGLVRVGE